MSHTYIQQIVHIIWSTRNQEYKIPTFVRNQLYAYIATVVKSKKGKLYLGGGAPDHIHCLLSLPPSLSLSTMMQYIKSSSSKWLKDHKLIDPSFKWEEGYLGFSVQKDRLDQICSYIKKEEERHEKISYAEEFLEILNLQNIQYEKKYFLTRSYSKVLSHIIWSTKNRIPFLDKSIRPEFYEFISQTFFKNKCIVHAIGGVEDHVHSLIEVPRTLAIADLVKEIKRSAFYWLLKQGQLFNDFQWQTGYGAFSVSLSAIEMVKKYIFHQEVHHQNFNYSDEWNSLVLKNN